MADPLVLDTPVKRTGRVIQIESMFDVAPSSRSKVTLAVPDQLLDLASGRDARPWNVGLIVGPSGAGKTSIARRAFGADRVLNADDMPWPRDRAVVDAFPADVGVKDVTAMLTSVGFGSPPAWLRPWHVLSTGERFRASLALALATADDTHPVVMDEFTSTVDRRVAQIGSAAIAKTVRRRGQRFVGVTCHFDVIEWAQPDWIYRPDTAQLEWRCLQPRPALTFDVRQVGRDAWPLFRHHHYLSGQLHVAARMACAFHDGEPIAFCAWYRFPHPIAKNIMVNHRTVVLPDWQGAGVGTALANHVGQMLHGQGDRFRTITAHPAMIAALRHSPRWREAGGQAPSNSRKPKRLQRQHASARKLLTRTFEYAPTARTGERS